MNRWERVPMTPNEQMWCRMADTCKACSEKRQGECREAAEREREAWLYIDESPYYLEALKKSK